MFADNVELWARVHALQRLVERPTQRLQPPHRRQRQLPTLLEQVLSGDLPLHLRPQLGGERANVDRHRLAKLMPGGEVGGDLAHRRALVSLKACGAVDETVERCGVRVRAQVGDREAACRRRLVTLRRIAKACR